MDGTFMFTGEHESAIQNMRECSVEGWQGRRAGELSAGAGTLRA
jgi:hypothetical protein